MSVTKNKTEVLKYETTGTCCKIMQVEICDNIVQNVDFFGGCDGNLKGLQALIKGMHIDEVIAKFSGITCDDKKTSCPDQLARFLAEYKAKK
jgi:uncharacterized protein (TIGR03905 family)